METAGSVHFSSSKGELRLDRTPSNLRERVGSGSISERVLTPSSLQAPEDSKPTPLERSLNESKSEGRFGKKAKGWTFLQKLFACNCFSCCPFGSAPRETGYRNVIPNHLLDAHLIRKDHPNRRYRDNRIQTTKYSILSFLPKNLFEQFHRIANLYFIFVVVLNWIPQIEAFGKELSMIPVVFVMAVTAVKDAFEDYRRYKSDQKINSSTCRVWNVAEKKYAKLEWKHVMVGDFVHLSCNEKIPADVLLLSSSDPLGVCYLETSNLDGESNLKERHVVHCMQRQDGLPEKPLQEVNPLRFRSRIHCESPNSAIYKFHGFLLHEDGKRESVNNNNLLLRGCELRNTDSIEGIVIYAGHDTKAMMNNSGPRYKRSELERLMNWDVVWCVVILALLCLVGALGSTLWLNSFEFPYSVVFLTFTPGEKTLRPLLEGFINFWSYVIVLQVMIPISLYVSVEIIKLGQVYFIMQDRELRDPRNGKKMQCRALNIPEELGQIQYVLSDKTGTLTENQMIFRRCTIAGTDFGSSDVNSQTEQDIASLLKRTNSECVKDVKPNSALLEVVQNFPPEVYWPTPAEDSLGEPADVQNCREVLEFFINMVVCNTVVVTAHPHVDQMNSSGTYIDQNSNSLDDNVSVPNSSRGVSPVPSAIANPAFDTDGFNNNNSLKPKLQDYGGPTPLDNSHPKAAFILHRDATAPASLFNTTETILSSTFTVGMNSIPEIRTESVASDPIVAEDTVPEKTCSNISPRLFSRPISLNIGKSLLNLPAAISSKLPGKSKVSPRSIDSTPAPLNPIYEAESPDELSLVYAAAAYGMRLLKRQLQYSLVEFPDGRRQKFQILHTLPFDPVRKRMSVIVKSPTTSNPVLYCKGADSAIMDLLSDDYVRSSHGERCIFKAQEYLSLYGSYGLRTLCLARRELSDHEYHEWLQFHSEAETAIDGREELLFESAERIETNLQLLGITGIEDRLQDGVPETIASLRQAGIKVWVLTGDKIETAVNIAYACKLFPVGMQLIQLCARNEADAKEQLEHQLEQLSQRNPSNTSEAVCSKNSIGVVIDGRTMAYCLRTTPPKAPVHPRPRSSAPELRPGSSVINYAVRRDNEEKLVELISRCTSVLCCRATPSQKSHMVKLVKNRLHGKALAIGDGANDVAMIQSADVGVGICGQEGMQAVMASDFALARFRFLKRLLLVHGHWCYDRLARTILYFFYKNALFVFTLFWFQFFCGFSSQVIIDPLYLMLYNLIFTSLPPLLFGVFDQDVSDHLLMDQPKLYSVGRTGSVYFDSDIGLWSFGFLIFSSLVIVNQLHLAVEVKSWMWPLVGTIVISVASYYCFALLYNALANPGVNVENPPYWVAQHMMATPVYWIALVFICILAILPRLTVKIVANSLAPSNVLLASLRFKNKQNQNPKGSKLTFVAWWNKKSRSVQIANQNQGDDGEKVDIPGNA